MLVRDFPGRRRSKNVHFCATSSRCQRNYVAGEASGSRSRSPRGFPRVMTGAPRLCWWQKSVIRHTQLAYSAIPYELRIRTPQGRRVAVAGIAVVFPPHSYAEDGAAAGAAKPSRGGRIELPLEGGTCGSDARTGCRAVGERCVRATVRQVHWEACLVHAEATRRDGGLGYRDLCLRILRTDAMSNGKSYGFR